MKIFLHTKAYLMLMHLVLAVFIIGCAGKSMQYLNRKGTKVSGGAVPLQLGNNNETVRLQYLGCGGVLVSHRNQMIMIDPFFSNQNFYRFMKSVVLGGKIKSLASDIDFAKQRVLDSLHITQPELQTQMQAFFIAHGHYDHAMDVPYLYKYWFNNQPVVYANASLTKALQNVVGNLYNAEEYLSTSTDVGRSIDLAGDSGYVMKVYPILGAHNPQAFNKKFFSGDADGPITRLENARSKTKLKDWLDGTTLTFLIDLVRDQQILFRMFIQSSSCNYPDGLPPKVLLDQKAIDIALMGVASYKYSVTTYPEQYLEVLKPKKLVLIHWEDFFRSYKKKPRSVRRTNIKKFVKDVLPACGYDEYILPKPGVVITADF